MGTKRDKLGVVKDILKAIQERDGRIKRTHILYKANLSHRMLKEYMDELISRGLVVEKKMRKGRRYVLTDRGHKFLSKYGMINNFMDFFGLDEW